MAPRAHATDVATAVRRRCTARLVRRCASLLLPSLLLAGARARAAGAGRAAARPPVEEVVETHAATWPLTLDVHVLIGVEPHGDRGTPIAFGAGAELLWRGAHRRLRGAVVVGGHAASRRRSTACRAGASPIASRSRSGWRCGRSAGGVDRPTAGAGGSLAGVGVQLGVTVEHLRTSDDRRDHRRAARGARRRRADLRRAARRAAWRCGWRRA